jgi:predicted nucleic acid-binding Zn ribbon protein
VTGGEDEERNGSGRARAARGGDAPLARAGDTLDAALRRLGVAGRVRGVRAMLAWEEIMGPSLAAEAHAVKLERGVLTVSCRSNALRHQLTLDRLQLLERLRALLGQDVVKDLRFRP